MYYVNWMSNLTWVIFQSLGSEEEIESDKEVQTALNQLLLIKNKAKFDLGIRLSQRRIRLNTWPHAFAQLKPILEAFEKEGAEVSIYWKYAMEDEFVDLELINLIKSHGPDWKKDVIEFLDCVSHFFIRTPLCGASRLSNTPSKPRSMNGISCIGMMTIQVLIQTTIQAQTKMRKMRTMSTSMTGRTSMTTLPPIL